MNWLTKTLGSSIGKKILMSLTGLFLCTFLVVHVSGNLQLFKQDDGFAFNQYTLFMTTNPLIKTISYLLYFSIIFHAVWSLYLTAQNRRARPVQYASFDGKANSHWTSRNMGILGTILLVFIAVHMHDFWWEYKFGDIPYSRYTTNIATGEMYMEELPAGKYQPEHYTVDGMEVQVLKDLYREVSVEFREWPLVLFYILAMFAVSFHLYHGFQSAFQSLGWRHRKYTPAVKFIGVWVFAIIIPLLFAAMPVYLFIKSYLEQA